MRTVSIINQKGGCGKTTSALSLAGYFAHFGLRTLLTDMDPQGHCAAGLAIPEQRIDLDVGDAMLAPDDNFPDTSRLLWRAARNLDLLPARMNLAGLESARGGLSERPDREHRLRAALERLAPRYDICVIDCAPSIGLLTFNALVAADAILIPVDTSFFALQGATRQLSTIAAMARRLGRDIPTWVLPTIHDTDSALAEDLLEELRRRFGAKVAPNPVRRDGALREAASFGQPIVEYAPDSPGAQDYHAIAQWIVERFNAAHQTQLTTDQPAPPLTTFATPNTPTTTHAEPETAPPTTPATRPAPATPTTEATPTSPEPTSRAADLAHRAAQLKGNVERITGGKTTLVETKPANAESAAEPAAPNTATTPPAAPPTPAPTTAVRLISDDDRPTDVHPSARRILGATHTPQGVLFVQPVTIGRNVTVAGTFNGWSATAHPLTLNRALGVYERCIPIPPGEHEYRLVIDGRWTNDPFNPTRVDNHQGSFNTGLTVPQHTPAPTVPTHTPNNNTPHPATHHADT